MSGGSCCLSGHAYIYAFSLAYMNQKGQTLINLKDWPSKSRPACAWQLQLYVLIQQEDLNIMFYSAP